MVEKRQAAKLVPLPEQEWAIMDIGKDLLLEDASAGGLKLLLRVRISTSVMSTPGET